MRSTLFKLALLVLLAFVLAWYWTALAAWVLLVAHPRFGKWSGPWSLSFWPWDAPMNHAAMWFSRNNLRRFDGGGSIFWPRELRKRIAETPWLYKRYPDAALWWAVWGFSGTIRIQTWPGAGLVRIVYVPSMTGTPWKVPGRFSYCATFRQWVATTILCHVVYRLSPPHCGELPQ